MFDVLWMESIMTLITMIPNIILFRDHPPTPPSIGSLNEINKNKVTIKEFMKEIAFLFKDINFCLMTLLFSLYFGGLKAYGVLASYLVAPFDYNPSTMSYLSVTPIASGFISTILVG